MRALIIEDELLLAWTIEDVLGDLGYARDVRSVVDLLIHLQRPAP